MVSLVSLAFISTPKIKDAGKGELKPASYSGHRKTPKE
jgi:hypothetical protein